MVQFSKPAAGSWTAAHPDLGAGLVSFDDSVSPEHFQRERRAIFQRAWLNVGRVDDLPQRGSWFTKDLLATCGSSIVVTRDSDDTIRAFRNVCRHRGNLLVWDGSPYDETSGRGRQLVCKYHGWRYGLDGACTFVHQEREFFDLDKAQLSLVPVHCDTFAGFVFVCFTSEREPEWTLRAFLGEMVGALEGYPFERMTERYRFRAVNHSNWKVLIDAFQEYYHVPPLHTHQLGPAHRNAEAEFEAAHYQLDGPHRMVSTSGSHKHEWPAKHLYPSEALFRSGNTGPWDAPDLGLGDVHPRGTNPGGVDRWGIDNFQIFPNLEILIYERGWYLAYRWW
jgi:glycine betaine catabolism A